MPEVTAKDGFAPIFTAVGGFAGLLGFVGVLEAVHLGELVGKCHLLDEGELTPEVDPVGLDRVVDSIVETETPVLEAFLGFGGERLDEVGSVQIVAKYDSDEGIFRDVMWSGDNPGNTLVVDEEADGEGTAMDTTRSDQKNAHREETSTQTYRPITRSEFDAFFDNFDIEFTREAYRWTDEWVYEAVLDGGEKCLRVFSSIDREDNASRGAGSDAIKSVLLLNVADEDEEPEWRPLRKPKRTYRIQTWPQNLREKLENAVATKDEMKACLECGRPMVLQSPKGKKRQFWGCSGYYERTPSGERECENTAPVQ